MIVVFLLFFVTCVVSTFPEALIFRTVTWDNYENFIAGGWHDADARTNTHPPFQYSKPSEFQLALHNLNSNASDIWGYHRPDSYYYDYTKIFTLNMGDKPEYCGLASALLKIKFYLESGRKDSGNNPASLVEPSPYPSCYLYNMDQFQWKTSQFIINIFKSKTIKFQVSLNAGGVVILDRVSLTYTTIQDEANCPYSCSSDCENKAIDCHNYYTCVDGRRKEFHKCSAEDGLAFNPKTGSCDLIENVEGCDPAKFQQPCKCKYRPHENNSTMYYFCRDTCHPENCVEKQCPTGLEWTKENATDHYQCAKSSTAS